MVEQHGVERHGAAVFKAGTQHNRQHPPLRICRLSGPTGQGAHRCRRAAWRGAPAGVARSPCPATSAHPPATAAAGACPAAPAARRAGAAAAASPAAVPARPCPPPVTPQGTLWIHVFGVSGPKVPAYQTSIGCPDAHDTYRHSGPFMNASAHEYDLFSQIRQNSHHVPLRAPLCSSMGHLCRAARAAAAAVPLLRRRACLPGGAAAPLRLLGLRGGGFAAGRAPAADAPGARTVARTCDEHIRLLFDTKSAHICVPCSQHGVVAGTRDGDKAHICE